MIALTWPPVKHSCCFKDQNLLEYIHLYWLVTKKIKFKAFSTLLVVKSFTHICRLHITWNINKVTFTENKDCELCIASILPISMDSGPWMTVPNATNWVFVLDTLFLAVKTPSSRRQLLFSKSMQTCNEICWVCVYVLASHSMFLNLTDFQKIV